MTSSADNYNHI